VKLLSRLVSPAGFGLVLLLFFLLPFLSVSCSVPDAGEVGLTYQGSDLVFAQQGTPEVPEELTPLLGEVPAAGDDQSLGGGVQILAIVVVVLAALGVCTALIPRLRPRMLGGAAVAGATLVTVVVTMVVAQSSLFDAVVGLAKESGAAENRPGMPNAEALTEEAIHSEIGFWLVVVILVAIAVVTTGGALFGERLRAARGDGRATVTGLPFDDHQHAPPDPTTTDDPAPRTTE
jgi:hypothetical protein